MAIIPWFPNHVKLKYLRGLKEFYIRNKKDFAGLCAASNEFHILEGLPKDQHMWFRNYISEKNSAFKTYYNLDGSRETIDIASFFPHVLYHWKPYDFEPRIKWLDNAVHEHRK